MKFTSGINIGSARPLILSVYTTLAHNNPTYLLNFLSDIAASIYSIISDEALFVASAHP